MCAVAPSFRAPFWGTEEPEEGSERILNNKIVRTILVGNRKTNKGENKSVSVRKSVISKVRQSAVGEKIALILKGIRDLLVPRPPLSDSVTTKADLNGAAATNVPTSTSSSTTTNNDAVVAGGEPGGAGQLNLL